MYIYKIEIENFRNFEFFSWKPNSGVNILFGCNGSGKTNLAEALTLTFSTNNFESYFDPSDYYLGDVTKQISIRVWIDDIALIPVAISEHLQHINEKDEFLPDDSQGNSKGLLIYQLESGTDRKMEWRFCQQTQQPFCMPQDRKAIDFINVDANRQPTKEVGLQTKSTFYKMSKDAISSEIERISKEIIQFADEKLSRSTTISGYLDTLKELGRIDIIDKYELLLKSPESSWNSSGYELGTSVGKARFGFERQSKGIQNLFLLLLMKKRLEGSGIVFIEELEQNLEPKFQRYIIDEYKKLSVGQLFITSHSPDVISHFNYNCIYSLGPDKAVCLQTELGTTELKDIHRTNKKEFISALMSTTVLLVEGDSEYESFPIYSYHCDNILSKYDIEVIRTGGKGKFEQYIKAFKKFGKTVYVLLDNDSDAIVQINIASASADIVFISQNCYEDLIIPNILIIAEKLNELFDFSVIKNKLFDLANYDNEASKHKDNKKKVTHDYIVQQCIDISTINSYTDLCSYRPLISYILHDSFASAYFARAVANLFIETGNCPSFFMKMMEHIAPKGNKLCTVNGYQNVFELNG